MTIVSAVHPIILLNDQLNDTDLASSRMCCSAMMLLEYLEQEKVIGLTKSGAFQRKFVNWAVDQFQWPEYTATELYQLNKVLNEDDVMPLAILHDLLRYARLIRHVKGQARLTKSGKDIVGDYGRLQALLFDTFFTRFDFSYYERWPNEFADMDTMHCIGVVQKRLGDWVNYLEFCGWCLPIPILRPQRGSVEKDAMFYLYTRLIRPLLWLGLVEESDRSGYGPLEEMKVRRTKLFDQFVRVEPGIQRMPDTLH